MDVLKRVHLGADHEGSLAEKMVTMLAMKAPLCARGLWKPSPSKWQKENLELVSSSSETLSGELRALFAVVLCGVETQAAIDKSSMCSEDWVGFLLTTCVLTSSLFLKAEAEIFVSRLSGALLMRFAFYPSIPGCPVVVCVCYGDLFFSVK